MKVLVLGYSVTAEAPGFAELASGTPEMANVEWYKIGLGGFMPPIAVHLFSEAIERIQPNIILLEQSTPAYRLFNPNIKEYQNLILALLRKAKKYTAKFSFLDLPRIDVDASEDWLIGIHSSMAKEHRLGHVVVPLDANFLRDTVHPTEQGRKRYADYAIQGFQAAKEVNINDNSFSAVDEFEAVSIAELSESYIGYTNYKRGGFEAKIFPLYPEQALTFKIDPPAKLVGAICLIGPRTGNIEVFLNAERRQFLMYDQYAYYNRLASCSFYSYEVNNASRCSRATFTQKPEFPSVNLLKGEKNFSSRIGGVSHLLIRRKPNAKYREKIEMEKNNKYMDKAFSRGFVLFNNVKGFSQSIAESEIGTYLSTWEKTFFGPAQLWYDRRLDFAKVSSPKFAVAVLGLCLNPFDGLNSNEAIAQKLYDALTENLESFYSYLDELSGSFVIIFRKNTSVKVLQDCAATKAVYYLKIDSLGVIAASHANLIALPLKLKTDERAAIVYESAEYRKDPSRYLPGSITPYKELYALTANTFLDFKDGLQKRFFPRGELGRIKLDVKLVKNVASIFRAQAKLLSERKRPMVVATTAGRDSRVSVAAFGSFPNTILFSFHIASSGHLSEDTTTAKLLARKLGKDIKIYDLENYKDAEFASVFKMTSPNGIWPAAAQCYVDEFPDNAIHVRSTVSEIGRMFYSKRDAKNVTPEGLARTYTSTQFSENQIVVAAMKDFIERSNFSDDLFYNYDLHDLFYWEHRNSKWQNILCMEAEMATDVFIPFNNRKLILLFLGLPEKERKGASLHVAITKQICPKISKIPYTS